ncbi:isocitrate lyase/PEP mutase family protein [Salinisphaera sp. T31B1]|uniref:isocitrate lyase/PEP mutase family protein n=1 Tax=Salinisphaera sp. T31B1 TaxID=727963 RepID=UPI00333E652B
MSSQLKELIQAPELLVAPGVFDLISAKVAQSHGFSALYMTGYGTVASHLGLPDAGLAGYRDMVDRVAHISARTTPPLIADGDTGYGGLLNVQHTVAGYERAGAQAIQLEDQESPKKCGHMLGRRVVAAEEMVAKIRVAVDTRNSDDFLIIARTDARTTLGLDEALRRAEAYAEAGADILFVESPESPDEMQTIADRFDLPLVANMVEEGRTPFMSAAELQAIGFSLAIYPASGFLSAAAAMDKAYGALKTRGTTTDSGVDLYPFQGLGSLLGFDDVYAFEQKYADLDD